MSHTPWKKPLTFEHAELLMKSAKSEPMDQAFVASVCDYVKDRERSENRDATEGHETGVNWVFQKGFSEDRKDIVFTFVNDEFAEMLGCSPDQVIGRSDRDFNKEQHELHKFDEADRRLLNGSEKFVFVAHETFTVKQSGKTIHLRTTKERIVLPNGKHQVRGVAKEISPDEIETARSCEVDGLLNVFQNNVVIKAPDGRIVYCNQHFASSHSYKPGEAVIGRTDYDHWPQEIADRFRNDDHRVMYTKEAFGPFDEHLVKPDGTEITLVTWKLPLFDPLNRNKVIATVCICELLAYRNPEDGVLKMRSHSECLASLTVTKNVLKSVENELISKLLPELRSGSVSDAVGCEVHRNRREMPASHMRINRDILKASPDCCSDSIVTRQFYPA